MKSLVLVVFLALVIAGVFVSDGVVQKKVVKTIPLQSTTTQGMTEQGGAEGFNHLFGTGIIRNGSIGGIARNTSPEGSFLGSFYGYSLDQDSQLKGRRSENPIEFEENRDTRTLLGTVVDQVGQYEGEELAGPLLHQDKIEGFRFAQPEVVSELAPSTIVYIGGTTIPLSSYQTTYGKYLWIENQGLRQYASMKQYSSLPLIAYTSSGGPGEILEMYPSNSNQGTYQKTYYNFNPGHNRIPYRGDVVGRHYLLFAMNDQSSNAIIIDVNNGMIGGSPVMLGTMPSGGV